MRVVPRVSHSRTAMSGKVGKNEAKRLKAQALKEFQSETTEEERERILRRGMGVDLGGALQKGEEKVFEKKLTKEEKKAAMAAKRAELAERRAARKVWDLLLPNSGASPPSPHDPRRRLSRNRCPRRRHALAAASPRRRRRTSGLAASGRAGSGRRRRARRRRREGGASRSRRRSRRRCGLTRRACQRRSGGRSESSREGAQREPRRIRGGANQREPRRSRTTTSAEGAAEAQPRCSRGSQEEGAEL